MSYTLITTTVPRSNSNAEFQAWGSQISAAIANCGLIKESDANVGTQINWATVAAPNAATQSRGYEIYRFDDAMQATTPVYFKLEYGSGSSNTIPGLWLTVGSGANGSGNVTGNTTTRQTIVSLTSAVAKTSYYSGANNRLCFVFCAGGTTQEQMTMGLERTLDANGAVTADGLAIILSNSFTKFQALWTPTTGNVTAWESTFGVLTPSTIPNSGLRRGNAGAHLAYYPFFFNQGAKWFPPQTMFVAYFTGEFVTGVSAPIPVYGANVFYMPMGNVSSYSIAFRGGYKTAMMMRFD